MTARRQWMQDAREATADQCIAFVVRHLEGMTVLRVPQEIASPTLLGYGWWVRVVRTGDAVRILRQSGFGHEAGVMVRTALHHAAALCWLVNAPEEAVEAVTYEDKLRKHNLSVKALDADWDLGEMEPIRKPEQKPRSMVYLSDFEKLCKDFDLDNFYLPYRVESGYFHPSILSADIYLEGTDGSVSLRTIPRTSGVELTAAATFVGLATSALAKLSEDSGLGRVVEELTRRLNVDFTVPIIERNLGAN
jgi:hypothetical protein